MQGLEDEAEQGEVNGVVSDGRGLDEALRVIKGSGRCHGHGEVQHDSEASPLHRNVIQLGAMARSSGVEAGSWWRGRLGSSMTSYGVLGWS